MVLNDQERRLVAVIQDGLPLVAWPYAHLATALGLTQAEVINRIGHLQATGVIKRLGVVVRHRELGYRANAMVVWDVPDPDVDSVGKRLGAVDCINLCYRRPRRPPDWPYNLFCMIHGRDRDEVLLRIEEIACDVGLEKIPRAVLFSGVRFKQRGARYVHAAQETAGG